MQRFQAASRPVPNYPRRLPPKSCDSHFHVFGDPERFPQTPAPEGAFRGIASIDDLLRVHKALGIERGVFVQPWAGYATDHRCLLAALEATSRDFYVGTAIIDETFEPRELHRLRDAGVRGTRLVTMGRKDAGIDSGTIRRIVEMIRTLDWYLKLHLGPQDLDVFFDELLNLEGVPIVFDHMSRVNAAKGMQDPHFRRVERLLRKDNVWMILSNGYHLSGQGKPWTDIAAIGRHFYEVAPTRCVWGSDWPHMRDQNEGRGREESEILDLLFDMLPNEKAIEAVLATNPARLHGFISTK